MDDPNQIDLFITQSIRGWPIKDDLASMEIPLFSLSKRKDTETREYRRGNKVVRIIPSGAGAATVYDKDLLIYIASLIIDAQNQGKPISRTVQITTIDFLQGTYRGDGRACFERILDMLRRLRGTTIETNIPTNGKVQTEGFALIDSYKIISEKVRNQERVLSQDGHDVTRVLCFTVTISEWLYNSLLSNEVLTIHQDYFRLTRSIDRRLYEIARKHCGHQPMWKINIDLLAAKVGIKRDRFKVRDEIRQAIEANLIPEYHLALDTSKSPDDVVFYTREKPKFHKELLRLSCFSWYESLERYDNVKTWRKGMVS